MPFIQIDNLIQSSSESKYKLEWIPYEEIRDIKPTQNDNVHCAIRKQTYGDDKLMLLLLGSSKECTPTLVSVFARKYSLPTHEYNSVDSHFRRYSKWLESRNKLI